MFWNRSQLRYETTPDQLRFVLTILRELLLAHPRIAPEPARARFIGFGEHSLDLEVFAYVETTDWSEYLFWFGALWLIFPQKTLTMSNPEWRM
jgi:hypothetical protein